MTYIILLRQNELLLLIALLSINLFLFEFKLFYLLYSVYRMESIFPVSITEKFTLTI